VPRPLTPRQRWLLAYAVRRRPWEISGRGGFTVARGLETRGLGVVRATVVDGEVAHVLEATAAGRAYVAEHNLTTE
jgi:hypothetical protein